MVKSRKFILLFLALLLPVVLFVFLKYFGKNEFTIPVYYQNSIPVKGMLCNNSIEFPYIVPMDCPVPLQKISVLSFEEPSTITTVQLNRIREAFENQVNVRSVLEGNEPSTVNNLYLDSVRYQVAKCNFLIEGDSSTVLVDGDRRIRGYYIDANLKDMDRLIMEVKILLGRY